MTTARKRVWRKAAVIALCTVMLVPLVSTSSLAGIENALYGIASASPSTTNLALGAATSSSVPFQNASKATDNEVSFIDNEPTTGAWYKLSDSDNASVNKAVYFDLDLGQEQELSSIKIFRMVYDVYSHTQYNDVIVQLSSDPDFQTYQTIFNNDTDNSSGANAGLPIGQSSYNEPFYQTKEGQLIELTTPTSARYIRMWSRGNYWINKVNPNNRGFNGISSYVEVQAFGHADAQPVTELVNVALGKSASSMNNGQGQDLYTRLPLITDGVKSPVSDRSITTEYKEVGMDGATGLNNGHKASWVQVDLEKPYPIEKIHISRMLYSPGYIKYFGNIVQLSNDPTFMNGVTTVYNNDANNYAGQGVGTDPLYEEQEAGQQINIKAIHGDEPVTAQYVRIWSRGHTWNRNSDDAGYSAGNFFREVEVFAQVDVTDPDHQPVIRNISSWSGKPSASGRAFENIVVQNGTRVNQDDAYKLNDSNLNTAAAHLGRGNQYIQFDYKAGHAVREIKIYRPVGTYNNVQIYIGNNPRSQGTNVFNGTGEIRVTDASVPQVITLSEPVSGSHIRIAGNATDAKPFLFSEIEINERFLNEKLANNIKQMEVESYVYNPHPSSSKYHKLVWEDDFNTLDESKWTVIDGMQNYATIYDREALEIQSGANGESYLNIKSDLVGLRTDSTDPNYVKWSSGRVESKNKFSFMYGRVDVRAKVSDSQGIWPAIWMLAQDERGHDEIDILEYLGQDKYDLWTTNHFGTLGIDKSSDGTSTITSRPLSSEFHVYGVEWTPDYIAFTFDGKEVFRTSHAKDTKQAMHPRPMFVILETQVGGGWVGPVDGTGNNTKPKNDYLIDWVKVYQEDNSSSVLFDDIEYLDGPVDKNLPVDQRNPYYASIYSHSNNLEIDRQHPELYFYSGQPKMETSRLRLTEAGKNTGTEHIIYKIDQLQQATFTTYYSVEPGVVLSTNQFKQAKSKLNATNELKFFYASSPNGPWISASNVSRTDIAADFTEKRPGESNYPRAEESNFSRHIFDVKNIPAGNDYIKVQFPVAGDMWDEIQLAKATFMTGKSK